MAKNISLVLGSGGARGYAHIGVIEELLQRGYHIEAIAGSSMGALIAGLYACGKLEEYKRWVLTLEWLDVAKLLDFSFSGGLIEGEKVFAKIEEMIGSIKIEELPIAYTAVATNLDKQKELWIQKGSLLDAIRASVAIPTIFTPKVLNKERFVDGGVLDPLPIAPTMAYNSDLIIAVSLNGKKKNRYDIKLPKKELDKETIFEEMFRHLKDKIFEEVDYEDSIFSIFNQTIDIMQAAILQHNLAVYPPDVLIEIPIDVCNFYDFHKAYELIEVGRAVAKEALEELHS